MTDYISGPTGRLSSRSARVDPVIVGVQGVWLARFGLTNGDRLYPWQADEILTHFVPGTIPLLQGHAPEGTLLGYVESLTSEGSDLHFTGTIEVSTASLDRLRRGVPISIEATLCGHRGSGPSKLPPVAVSRPHFRGTARVGWNLLGVALLLNGERPASTASVVWRIDKTRW